MRPDLRLVSVGDPVPTSDGFAVEAAVSADVRSATYRATTADA